MKHISKFSILLALLFICLTHFTLAYSDTPEEWLPAIYSDNMVIPKGKELIITFACTQKGKATINFKNKTYAAKVENGWFYGSLPKQSSYGGPFKLRITAGKKSQTIQNVWIGEVLFFSGQSNMEFPIRNLRPELNKLPEPGSHVSFFCVQKKGQLNKWITSDNPNIPDISALAYLSSIKLSQNMNIPLGVVTAAVGGSRIEEWIDPIRTKDKMNITTVNAINSAYKGAQATNNSTIINKICSTYKINTMTTDIASEKRLLLTIKESIESEYPEILFNFSFQKKTNYHEINAWMSSKKGIPFNWSINLIKKSVNYPYNILIWYQGESNGETTKSAQAYSPLLEDFTKGIWARQKCNTPILIVQLPEFELPESNDQAFWSYIREAQANAAGSNSAIRLIPALGTGSKTTVHPPDKRILANRIALQLEKSLSGKPSVTPQISNITVAKDTLRLTFDNTYEGLRSVKQTVTGFSIANSSSEDIPVRAKLLTSKMIELAVPFMPKEIRYAWGNYPEFSLYNSLGIPVPAFRLIAK